MIARSPADDDFREVLALVTASDRALIGDTDRTKDDLHRQWHDVDLTRDAWMVELGDRLGGYATFEDRGGGRRAGMRVFYRMTLYEKELRGRRQTS